VEGAREGGVEGVPVGAFDGLLEIEGAADGAPVLLQLVLDSLSDPHGMQTDRFAFYCSFTSVKTTGAVASCSLSLSIAER
jgi:hypothetical protein